LRRKRIEDEERRDVKKEVIIEKMTKEDVRLKRYRGREAKGEV
jgi:hypothetical protein